MIDLHYWPTPNGHKITLFLEETGLPYRIVPVDIGRGEQFRPDFLAIAPNNRMPAIVDHAPADGGAPVSVFESGAILLYLAEKTGRFIARRPARPGRGAAMAVLADGRPGADGRPEPPFRRLRARAAALRHRPLRQRDQPALRRAGPAPGRPPLRGRRGLLDRRHGVLPLDRAATSARARSSPTSPTSSAGSAPSRPGRRPSAPTRSASGTSAARRRWTRRPRGSCSARPRRY